MDDQPPSLRVLYLEDNPVDADLARRALAGSAPEISLEIAQNLASALACLEKPEPGCDLVLSDLRLPDGSGLDLLAWVRARNLPLPVILLTSSGDQSTAVAALKAGADDYLIKHGDYLERLPDALRRAARHFREAGNGLTRALRVFYAEDNQLDIDLTRRHLARHAPHIRLEIAASGAELLAMLPNDRATPTDCDIILLDFRLPDMDALELIRIIRSERDLDLPVVMVSGQGSEEVVAAAMRLGVEDYLIKHEGYLLELPATLERSHRQAQLRREHEALKASEQQLRRLEERLRSLFDHALDGILAAEIESGKFVTGNPAICRMLGYELDELLSLGVENIPPPENLPWLREDFARHLRGEATISLDIPLLRKDGGTIHADIKSSPAEIDGKHCLVGIFRDNTERRQAEERLRLDAAALAASRDAVAITDLTPAILGVNPAFTKITGYSEEEVLGQNPRILASGRHDRAFYQGMWTSLLETGFWRGEIWNRRKNGEAYPELLSISTVYDKLGKPSHYVAVATDLALIKQSEEQLKYLAHYDPLTGLPNRLLLEARLQHSLERARRNGTGVAMLIVDLDHFKLINDSLGHADGDRLLAAVSKRLQGRMREEDTMARIAGDEFALVMENITGHHEAEIAARGIEACLEAPFAMDGGQEIYVRVSIGISLYPEDGGNAADLLLGANAAVHRAKEQGGNQLCHHDRSLNIKARTSLDLEAALRRALEQGEFVLHYQPKVHLRHGRITGAEALIRWQRPGHGLVPPLSFIPVAERSGLIKGIGSWVLEEACRQLRLWRENRLDDIHLAVNVSARQFHGAGLDKMLKELFAHYGIEPDTLTLELTESMLMHDPEQAVGRLGALRDLGARLSLDDFGTGYSSLSYLSRFPIDQMKIDRSFVKDIVVEPGAATIATSIIGLAHRMGLGVVAEGVENEEQLGYLRQNACDEMQGYLSASRCRWRSSPPWSARAGAWS